MDKLNVALMGLGEGGWRLAEALLSSTWCRLVAVASRKSTRIERFSATHPDTATYDDFRSLIVENALDALFVALPPFLRAPYLTLAAERGLPVWMLPPPARNFKEMLDLLAVFERTGCVLAVSREWDTQPPLGPEQAALEGIGRLFLGHARVQRCLPEDLDWRGDSQRAAGGVLLDAGYPLADKLVQALGMPETVYALTAGVSRPVTRFPCDTEDTAAVLCRFPGGAIASLTACWSGGPDGYRLDLHGTQGSVRIDERQVRVRNREGEACGPQIDRPSNPFLAQIDDFLSRLQTNPRSIRSTLREHLPTLAVIESAYLSARTGEAESPQRLLEMHATAAPHVR